MEKIEVFLQGESLGEIRLVEMQSDATVADLVAVARDLGIPAGDTVVQHEDDDEERELTGDQQLSDAGIHHRSRIHCHRCRKVAVTVNFNIQQESHPFPPSATVERVKQWADRKFHLEGPDATEHALQICGTTTRPSEDIHIGTLVTYPGCQLWFDLVPKVRVEG